MKWQVKYALAKFREPNMRSSAEHVEGDLIRVVTSNQPDVIAAISGDETINEANAIFYSEQSRAIDFVCGYRSICVWEGNAIRYLEAVNVGWGNFATLYSAALEGNARSASHKVYRFADRLLRQYPKISRIVREYDRVHSVTLANGMKLRIGMISEYQPTADAVRSLLERVGRLDIAWNINPNGNPTTEAIAAGRELGCEVMKWHDLKERMNDA